MASKSNGLESSEWARAPPPSGSIWARIGKAIYNPEEKTFLGRTPKRWGIVIIFYLVFYAVLAAMFAICMVGMLGQIDGKIPYYTLEQSLIGISPGVDFRPRPTEKMELKYIRSNTAALEAYKKELDAFLLEEQINDKTECVAADNYGIPDSPCVYIKLNKVYGWKPDYYSASDLPADMPDDLKNIIATTQGKQIWVSCWDEKSNETKIEYPWGRGLPNSKYPFFNEDGYISPLVAVKITAPDVDKIVVRCRAWAKNIIYNPSIKEPSGHARFHLQFKDNAA
ncbi:sodium/potassium-transporting ATPase subunit beta-1-like [Epargyreus clarus]|uniref:sodium/potassium-transporting ATPase subunit beta-1-like n=1 Tax=Epargyreus clarus TaxID=520877 RepID=UPI003C2E91C8